MSIAVNEISNTASWTRLRDVLAIASFCAVLTVLAWRLFEHRPLPGPASADRWALASFRDAIYYPVRAVRDGVNPYDGVRDGNPERYLARYPVGDYFPFYSPLILLGFAPLAMLPFEASMIAFAALNAVLFVLLAWTTLRVVGQRPSLSTTFGLATLLLASQPGRGAFNSGQVALPLALASLGALQFGDRFKWRSAALVAFSTLKPTFGGPIGLFLAASRNWRSALAGLVLGGVIFLCGITVIFARSGDMSIARLGEVLAGNQSQFVNDPGVVTRTNRARIDLPAAIEYLAGRPLPAFVGMGLGVLVTVITAWVLFRDSRTGDTPCAASTQSALLVVAMFLCVYHNIYDAPLLVLPAAACLVATHKSWLAITPVWRRWIFLLLLVPFVNFLWTDGFRSALHWSGIVNPALAPAGWDWFSSSCAAANGMSLAGAWGILLVGVAGARKGTQL